MTGFAEVISFYKVMNLLLYTRRHRNYLPALLKSLAQAHVFVFIDEDREKHFVFSSSMYFLHVLLDKILFCLRYSFLKHFSLHGSIVLTPF